MEERAKDGGFSQLQGKTLTKVLGCKKGSERVDFYTSDGEHFRMDHYQDCCESTSQDEVGDYGDTETWTFYRLQTIKGSLLLRWHGESNGYYSESVDFVKVKEN